eukprot:288367-Rhodomonas_salina.1
MTTALSCTGMTELPWAGAVGRTACLPDHCIQGAASAGGEKLFECVYCKDELPLGNDMTNMYCVNELCLPNHPHAFACIKCLSRIVACPVCRKNAEVLMPPLRNLVDPLPRLLDAIRNKLYGKQLEEANDTLAASIEVYDLFHAESKFKFEGISMWSIAEFCRRLYRCRQNLVVYQNDTGLPPPPFQP